MAWSSFTVDSMIDEWGKVCLACKNTNKGTSDGAGIYSPPGEEWVEIFGVIAAMTNKSLMPADYGAYTSQDKYFITRENCQVGILIKDVTDIYKIFERASYGFFDQTDLFVYKLKLIDGRLDNSDGINY